MKRSEEVTPLNPWESAVSVEMNVIPQVKVAEYARAACGGIHRANSDGTIQRQRETVFIKL